jgi:tetratricopeptide (TPR) repeat protein
MNPNPTVIQFVNPFRSTGPRWMNGILFTLLAVVMLSGCTPPWADAMFEGKTQLEKGEFKDAINSFKQATRLQPELARAWNYLGLAYHRDRQFAEAIAAYNKAYNTDNNLAEAVYNLGYLRLETGVYEDAIHWFKIYQMLRPQSTAALPYLALAHISLNELDEAQKLYDLILRQEPNDPKAYNGMGLIQQRKGNPRESYNYFHTALERDPEYTPAMWNQGIIAYPALQRPDLAVNKMRRFTYKAPQSPLAPIAKSIAEDIEARLFKKPEPIVEAPPAEQPKEQGGKTTEEIVAHKVEETTPAEEPTPAKKNEEPTTLKTVSDQEPAEALPNNDIQPVAPEIEKPQITQREVENPKQPEVRKTTPVKPQEKIETPTGERPTSQTNVVIKTDIPKKEESKPTIIVDIPRTANDDSRAVVEMERPVIVPPSEPGVTPLPQGRSFKPYRYLLPGAPLAGNRQVAAPLFDRANRALERSDYNEAVTQYERAISADPSFFEAYFNLGLAALSGGNAEKALPAYEYALAIDPQHRDSRYNLALGLIQKDHLRDAARELETLLKANPEDKSVIMRLGELYSGPLQRPVRTREVYQQLLKAAPTPDEVSTARSWLHSNP